MNDISITEDDFLQIVFLLKDSYGINLSKKKNLIVGRLQNHLRRSDYSSFGEFFDYVKSDKSGEAVTLLINKLTTNYTFFMREIEHFDFFRGAVLPQIAKSSPDKDMRIWSAGCSSGEEPYSIAMCIADFFAGGGPGKAIRGPLGTAVPATYPRSAGAEQAAASQTQSATAGFANAKLPLGLRSGQAASKAKTALELPVEPASAFSRGVHRDGWDSKVLATDISERVLSMAADGRYLAENLEPLPPSWRQAFFRPDGADGAQAVEWLRKEIIFRKFNLMERVFPFRRKFHIIWCRNVMIYFDGPTRRALIDKFYDCTEDGGYLFIGHSESIARGETRYKYVLPAIYRKEP